MDELWRYNSKSKKSQSQNDKYCTVLLRCGTYSSQIQRQEVEWWLPGVGGRREWGRDWGSWEDSLRDGGGTSEERVEAWEKEKELWQRWREIFQGRLREMRNDWVKSWGKLGGELGKDLGGVNPYLISVRNCEKESWGKRDTWGRVGEGKRTGEQKVLERVSKGEEAYSGSEQVT